MLRLTIGQRAQLAGSMILGSLRRAFVGLILLGLFALVGGAALAQSLHPPDPPWWNWDHWVSWFERDRQAAITLIISAFGSSAGLALSVFQVWFSTGARKAEERHVARIEALEQRLGGQLDAVRDSLDDAAAASESRDWETHALLRALLERQDSSEGRLPVPSPEAVTRAVQALRAIEDNPETADQRARALLLDGEVEGAFATLRAAATTAEIAGTQAKNTADLDSAEKWRRLGALAYLVDVEEAREAYTNADRLVPDDFWTVIYLARLSAAAGDLAGAHSAAERALGLAQEERDRGVALDELGDVAVSEGELPAARKAFEDSLAIRKALSERDPGNTGWKRDLSVSYERLGDVAEALDDIESAIHWYEESLPIAEQLAARFGSAFGFQKDLEITRARLVHLHAKLK